MGVSLANLYTASTMLLNCIIWRGRREGGREGGKKGGREGGREGGDREGERGGEE